MYPAYPKTPGLEKKRLIGFIPLQSHLNFNICKTLLCKCRQSTESIIQTTHPGTAVASTDSADEDVLPRRIEGQRAATVALNKIKIINVFIYIVKIHGLHS